MTTAPNKLTINEFDYKVKLELKTKKNSSARVYGDTIVLRISNKITKTKQNEHVNFLLENIEKKLSKKTVQPIPIILDMREAFVIKDQTYRAQFVSAYRKSCKMVIEDNNTFIFTLPYNYHPHQIEEAVKKMLVKALSQLHKEYLEDMVANLNYKYFNNVINNVAFKPFKSKWGECNSQNDISINPYLLFAPDDVLEYIIIHEIAHIGMLNHSKGYWNIVDRILPDRKSKENWLKNNGTNILNMKIVW